MMAEAATDWPGLGMPHDRVVLAAYDPRWPTVYDREAARIRDACGDAVTTIDHVGSTAVPGLAAKPIVDIMPGLVSFEAGLNCVEPMRKLGYIYRGEMGIAGRHYFNRDHDGLRVAHVHMFVVGCDEWRRHNAFRDYLRVHPDAAKRYEALKRELAERHRHEREAYTDAKTDFIRGIDSIAQSKAVATDRSPLSERAVGGG